MTDDAGKVDAPTDGDEQPDTQEDQGLTEGGKKAIQAERERAKNAEKAQRVAEKAMKELEARVAEFEDRDRSETERLQAERDRIGKERDEFASELVRFRVARDKGITGEAVDLITATDQEAAEAQADRILALIGARDEGDSKPETQHSVVSLEGKSPSEDNSLLRQMESAFDQAFKFGG